MGGGGGGGVADSHHRGGKDRRHFYGKWGTSTHSELSLCSKQRPLDFPREDDIGQYSRYVEYIVLYEAPSRQASNRPEVTLSVQRYP